MARRAASPSAPWGWALAGTLVDVLGALLVFAPAHWVAAALSQASEGRVQLLEPRGTLWNGSAQAVLTAGVGGRDAARLAAYGERDAAVLAGCKLGHFVRPSPIDFRTASESIRPVEK